MTFPEDDATPPGCGALIHSTGAQPWWLQDHEVVIRHLPCGLSERKASFVKEWSHPFRLRKNHPFYSGYIVAGVLQKALEKIRDIGVSDPVEYVRMADDIACQALAEIEP